MKKQISKNPNLQSHLSLSVFLSALMLASACAPAKSPVKPQPVNVPGPSAKDLPAPTRSPSPAPASSPAAPASSPAPSAANSPVPAHTPVAVNNVPSPAIDAWAANPGSPGQSSSPAPAKTPAPAANQGERTVVGKITDSAQADQIFAAMQNAEDTDLSNPSVSADIASHKLEEKQICGLKCQRVSPSGVASDAKTRCMVTLPKDDKLAQAEMKEIYEGLIVIDPTNSSADPLKTILIKKVGSLSVQKTTTLNTNDGSKTDSYECSVGN